MKIFIGYGYNDRDRWIEEMVFPLVRAFGSEVETGEVTYGKKISDAVKDGIKTSDAVIVFATKRDAANPVSELTHRWVLQELAIADFTGKPFVEVREIGVSEQDGMEKDYQRIEYDETARDECLVKIVQALGIFHQSYPVRVQLLPKEFASGDLRPLVNQNLLTCDYVIRSGNHETPPINAVIKKIRGGLFIDVPPLARNAMIQINLRHGTTKTWSSDYDSLDAYGIHLEL